MRPRQLTMKAFGPYGGIEYIDFTQLEESNMFLIHGPTGAGKTTILDAICYALYGATNGGERTAESMRSKFAKDDECAEVELVFSIREAIYKITRSPRFERPKKRGTGTTVEEVRATLYKQEEEGYELIAAKPQEVDRHIQQLLTFNVDQFRQVIMIAQNKFRELLLAPSKERQKILQDIFETGIYQHVEKSLDQMNTELGNQLRDKQVAYESVLEHIEHEDHEQLTQYIATKLIGNTEEVLRILTELVEQKGQAKQAISQEIQVISQQLRRTQEALAKEKEHTNLYHKQQASLESLKTLEQEDEAYEQLSHKIKQAGGLTGIVQLEERIETLRPQLQHNESTLQDIKACLHVEKQAVTMYTEQKQGIAISEPEIESCRKEHQILEGYKPKLESIKVQKQEVLRLEKEGKMYEQAYRKLEGDIQTLTKTLTEREERIKQKEVLFETLTAHQVKAQKVNIILERKQEMSAKEQQIAQTRKQYARLRTELANYEQAEAAIQASYDNLVQTWVQGQASELAERLVVGQSCPVCGSTEHPHKAKRPVEVVTLETIKKQDAERNRLTSEMSRLKNEQQTALTQGMTLKGEIDQMTAKMQEIMEDAALVDEAFQEQVQKVVKDSQDQLQILQQEEQYVKQEKSLLEQATKQLEVKRSEMNEVELKLAAKQSAISAVMSELPETYHQTEELEAHLRRLVERIETFEQTKEQVLKALELHKLSVVKYTTQCQEKEEQLSKQREDLQLLGEQFKREREKLALQNDDAYQALKGVLVQLEAYKQKLEGFNTQKAVLKASIEAIAKELSAFDPSALEIIEATYHKELEEKEALVLQEAAFVRQTVNYTKQIQQLESLYEANKELVHHKRIVGAMSDMAKGKNSKGLSFERYIQSSIFDEVLESANQKLRPMTGSRYELFRTDAMKRKNAQAGLDIAVQDYYVGEMRAVSTLSGGEGFMAALALALGLADVISRLAGASTLETMFIDEGFGTLDEESLEMAIKVLLNLQDTGRLVGIISHVRELREQIPAKLEIIATKQGSRTRFRV